MTVEQLPIRVEWLDGIAHVVLNNPRSRNALTPEMLCRLADAVVEFSKDDRMKVMVISGEGEKAFCAGGDLARTLPLMTGDRETHDEWDRRVLHDPVVMPASSLRDFPLVKPVVAAVNGACYAAGFELLLGCDIRIASTHAEFGLPEAKRALIPFAGSLARLARQIPQCVAMELLLTGNPISAERALAVGLVNQVVEPRDVLPRALEIAKAISQNGPLAVQQIKRTVIRSSGSSLDESFQFEDEAKQIVLRSTDAREGPRAFMEKRAPTFVGR